jgi:hypothetical protein
MPQNGSNSCVGGVCVPICNPGFDDCDGDPNDGCETNLHTDESHCGACDDPCSNVLATPFCMGGECVGSCTGNAEDCDNDIRNGCDDVTSNPLRCGSCTRACDATNVVALSCSGGDCDSVCEPGFSNCNTPSSGSPDDGCETADSDAECGSCDHSCDDAGALDLVCTAFAAGTACGCSPEDSESCKLGGSPMGNVCELSGICSCDGQLCNPGEGCDDQQCSCDAEHAPCAPGAVCCRNGCQDTQNDPQNCGGCGRTCLPGFECANGVCHCGMPGPSSPACDAGTPGECISAGQTSICRCPGPIDCAVGKRCLANGQCG